MQGIQLTALGVVDAGVVQLLADAAHPVEVFGETRFEGRIDFEVPIQVAGIGMIGGVYAGDQWAQGEGFSVSCSGIPGNSLSATRCEN